MKMRDMPVKIVSLYRYTANTGHMYFDNYKEHNGAKLDSSLFWEYDLSKFDFELMRDIVVQRVVERGMPEDWYAALNLYGKQGFREAVQSLPYLNDKDMNFVSILFEIPLSEMKCYKRKQSRQLHWNS